MLNLKGDNMSEERKKILNMVAEGKITPEEGDRLLGALRDSDRRGRFLKVRVTDVDKNRTKARIDIPIGVVKAALKIGTLFKGVVPEGQKVNINGNEISLDGITPEMIDTIVAELGAGGKFTLVEVHEDEKGEHVEVYIE
jgi:hypothetical protein